MNKSITHKYTFSKEERNKLLDVQAGLVISNAQINGLQIYKSVILEEVYKRLKLNAEPKEGFTKTIEYNLGDNEIIHTETPIKK